MIELIIVIVVIAVGATLLTPGLSNWLLHYRLRSATRDIVSTMRIAQMKAISNNLTYQVSFDPPNKSYQLEYLDTGGGSPILDGEVQVLNRGVTINTSFAGNIATFFPDSRVDPGIVNLFNAKSSKTIRLTGRRIRVE